MTDNKNIGKSERASQDRIVKLFQQKLNYHYLGDWTEKLTTQPVEEDLLLNFLTERMGYSPNLAKKAIKQLVKTTTKITEGLYTTNKAVYELLRYGVNLREEIGEQKQTVQLIDWKKPENNDFALAEEATVVGKHYKRPDLVIYVNGIAIGIIELKRSKVGLTEGIRQNLDNQTPEFIQRFFTTMQLVLAGNDTQGLRYGTIETPEKYYLEWKEEASEEFDYRIDQHLVQIFDKTRLLELIHDFIVFDKGVKKISRPNQYFGVKAAQTNVLERKGGILWHTQGSGKSLTMLWLTKWIRENVDDSRILIITDREALDDQIEKLFVGVNEHIYRTKSGQDLLAKLNSKEEMLMCSLVHKFGRHGTKEDEGDYDAYIQELKSSLPTNFKAKGDIYVFVDECHRTQSDKLHKAMKNILPNALFIGFTGTPLLKKNKKKSIEVFGPYIGDPYKFHEAVADGVVLDLLYEARDVEQFITDQQSIDEWFDAETQGLTDVAKRKLKVFWGTMQKVLGSKSRLQKIVFDIIKDFKIKPRLSTGEGNALLVSSSVYQACKYYELFQANGFKDCAIITSYQPHHSHIKGETTGEDSPTDKLKKYEVYTKMLNGKTTEAFEKEVKNKFINEPAKMKLLIVVDKLLTGFDVPSASYLYIDKSMQDHGLFQAICRVNRVDGEAKDYGYIIDYKDLFKSLEKSIHDYTDGAFDDYDFDDVNGLLKDRIAESKDQLETALEVVRALCEPVHPKDEPHFIRYFCGDSQNTEDLKVTEERRVILYKAVAHLIRTYSNVANELFKLGYTKQKAEVLKKEVKFYADLRDTIKQASGDYIDLKQFEPGMRQLMDMYLDANASKKISDFENKTLVDLIVHLDEQIGGDKNNTSRTTAISETIENNMRRAINEAAEANPRYFATMSGLLNELIQLRKLKKIQYEEYLKKIKDLAAKVADQRKGSDYPSSLETRAQQALYDNLEKDEELTLKLHETIMNNKLDDWRDGGIKEKKLMLTVNQIIGDPDKTLEIMDIIKAQSEY